MAQTLKRLPGMWETQVQSLGREDPLEKEMATHSSTLAWRIPWREEPGRLQSMASQRVSHWATEHTHIILYLKCVSSRDQLYVLKILPDNLILWLVYLVYIFTSLLGFPGGAEVKASAWNAGDPGSIPGSGRSPREGNGTPLQYSCLENPMEGGAW